MDKRPTYPGAIPLDLDILTPQRNAELALGAVLEAVFGSTTAISGLAVAPTSPASMQVKVGPGCIIFTTTVDTLTSGFGSLPVDNANALVKVGHNLTPTTMSTLTAPAIAGQSQNWLIEAQFIEADGTPVVLPYYNAADPAVPYTGPANSGTTNNTARTNRVQLQWKGGTAATTGTQNTPSPDAGWTGVAVVTVANGQSSITASSIVPYSLAPFVPTKLPQLRKQLTADLSIYVSPTGNDTNNSGLALSSPFLTLQRAWNYIISTLDLNGFNVTVNVANGTYSGGLNARGSVAGLGTGNTVSFVGNVGSPGSVIISTTNAHAISAQNGANFNISGFQLQATGTLGGAAASGILSTVSSNVTINGAMIFGACTGFHLWATQAALITGNAITYTVSGSSQGHLAASGSGSIVLLGPTINVSGTLSFSIAFASAGNLALVSVTGSAINVSGTVTGTRYSVTSNSVISTSGGGANVFPGTVAGATSTGGQYL